MMDCPSLGSALLFLAVGAWLSIFAVASWVAPDWAVGIFWKNGLYRGALADDSDVSPEDRELRKKFATWFLRFVLTLVVSGSLLAGISRTVQALRCGQRLSSVQSFIFPLELHYAWWMPILVVAFGFAGWRSRVGSSPLRVLWGACVGFSASQFFVAPNETQQAHWFAVGITVTLVFGILQILTWLVNLLVKKFTQEQSSPSSLTR